MFPVLFSIGTLSVSSYGVFLAAGFLLAIFLVWRLSRAWDLDEEKILDLTLLTFLGGLIGARLYFAIEHLQFFASSPLKIILINKYPGFSFWGAFLGGWLTLYFLIRRFKLNFWQVADIASVGFLGGLIFSDLGCFLGGCNVGIPSNAFFATTMVGQLGRRWPVQGLEALLLAISLFKIWSQATHFHQRGKIVSMSLIYLGVIKLLMEPVKQVQRGYFFDIVLTALGIAIFYRVTSRNIASDIKNTANFILSLIREKDVRIRVLQQIKKSWYNQKTLIYWQIRSLKKILRKINVRLSYKTD